MKIKKYLVLMIFVFMMSTVVGCSQKIEQPKVLAVAKVGEIEIPKDEYLKRQKLLKNVYISKLGKDIWTQPIGNRTVKSIASEELLEVMIKEILIWKYMEQHGYIPMEDEIQKRYTDFQEAIKNDPKILELYEGLDTDEQFVIGQITKQIYQQAFYDKMKDNVRADVQMLEDAYKNDIVRVSAGHILLTDETLVDEVVQKLSNGEEFANLAIEYSQDPSSAMNGGSLGFFAKGKMPPAFEEKVFSMQKGEISEPIKTQRGYHIIILDDTQTLAQLEEFGASQEELDYHKNKIIEEKSIIESDKILSKLSSDIEIQRFLEVLSE